MYVCVCKSSLCHAGRVVVRRVDVAAAAAAAAAMLICMRRHIRRARGGRCLSIAHTAHIYTEFSLVREKVIDICML